MEEQCEEKMLGYGRGESRWRKIWRVGRWFVLGMVGVGAYVGCYLGFAERSFLWGGGFAVKYPGAVRFYAVDTKMAVSLGSGDEDVEEVRRKGGWVGQFDTSVLMVPGSRWGHGWRVFYLLERLELVCRGETVLAIAYSGSPGSPGTSGTSVAGGVGGAGVRETGNKGDGVSQAAESALPLLGASYGEWFVRGGRMSRLIKAVYAARDAKTHEVSVDRDVYLFEWELGGEWGKEPRTARVKVLERNHRIKDDKRWMTESGRFIGWDEETGVTRLVEVGGKEVAKIGKVGPVRCCELSAISVSSGGKFFAGETVEGGGGLKVFRGDTFECVRTVKEGAGLAAFFKKREDELDEKNSSCFLLDDGRTLLRVVTIYKKKGDGFEDGTRVVILDVETGKVREVGVPVGARCDVKQVAGVKGHVVLYLTYVEGDSKWKQCLFDVEDGSQRELHPENAQVDMVAMGWDAERGVMVDLPGFEAGPGRLNLDAEIFVEELGGGATRRGTVRYGDGGKGYAFTEAGVMSLGWKTREEMEKEKAEESSKSPRRNPYK